MDINNEDERYYYDNRFPFEKDEDDNINVDRIYRLDCDNFSNEMWKRLEEIYSLLPQYIDGGNCCPMWFGNCELSDDEEVEYYLWASVEPSGIQFSGHLKYIDWLEWEKIFHEHIFDLPFRDW